MRDGIGLVANKIIEAIGAVGIDEAVADPLACAHGFVDIGHDVEGSFDAIFVAKTLLECFNVALAGEAEDVEGLFTGKCNKLTRF